ncbi:MAG: hypothetical protein IKX23_11570 [Treponema sp.]|nr:hypothetical protein [Treponema sp.]
MRLSKNVKRSNPFLKVRKFATPLSENYLRFKVNGGQVLSEAQQYQLAMENGGTNGEGYGDYKENPHVDVSEFKDSTNFTGSSDVQDAAPSPQNPGDNISEAGSPTDVGGGNDSNGGNGPGNYVYGPNYPGNPQNPGNISSPDDYIDESKLSPYSQDAFDIMKKLGQKNPLSAGYHKKRNSVDQFKIGEDLGLPKNKTCRVAAWVNIYMDAGLTYDQCIEVMKNEIKEGRIEADAYMKDQNETSRNLAKELKQDSYDGKYLQQPFHDGIGVNFSNEADFYDSQYDYGLEIVKGNEFTTETHTENIFNSPNQTYDPYPGGVSSCTNWDSPTIKQIIPLGWYK